MVDKMYSTEIQLNWANSFVTEAPNDINTSEMYAKRDDFDYDMVVNV